MPSTRAKNRESHLPVTIIRLKKDFQQHFHGERLLCVWWERRFCWEWVQWRLRRKVSSPYVCEVSLRIMHASPAPTGLATPRGSERGDPSSSSTLHAQQKGVAMYLASGCCLAPRFLNKICVWRAWKQDFNQTNSSGRWVAAGVGIFLPPGCVRDPQQKRGAWELENYFYCARAWLLASGAFPKLRVSPALLYFFLKIQDHKEFN